MFISRKESISITDNEIYKIVKPPRHITMLIGGNFVL